jgi:glycosyltransferase involved in cell wall biosynthesis
MKRNGTGLAHKDLKIMIVIPVYNNPWTLRDVVARALRVHGMVMVVDDGSRDAAEDLLKGMDIHIVSHGKNRGKGSAIMTGAGEAGRLGMTHIVTMDADGQHDPADFMRFLPVIRENPHAIVIGRRYFEGTEIPRLSVFGRNFSNFWMRLQTGISVGDTQSGFRAYPLAVLEGLSLNERHYSFEVEVLVKAAWADIEILETDISVYYPPPEKRISHFRGFLDNFRISLLNARLTMRSILPMPHRKIHFKNGDRSVTVLHPITSLKTLLTENTTPEKLAAAGVLGVFLGALPLIACHTIIIILATGFLRLNKVVAVATSQLCMPPIVPALCIEAGYFMRNGRFLTDISLETIGYQALQRLYEWLIGSFFVGPVMGFIVGIIIYVMAFLIVKGKRAIYR